jgi:hypothetical protein
MLCLQAVEIPRLALSTKLTRSSTYGKYACGLVNFVSLLYGFFNSLPGVEIPRLALWL